MRIRIHPSFGIYLFCIACFSSLYDCLGLLIAFLIHEFCHFAAAKLVGEQIAALDITPCGGVMIYKSGTVPNKGIKGILVHSAGPAGNWLMLLTAGIPAIEQCFHPAFIRSLLLANLSLLTINLLPVLPLDGGHIVFCLGYYFFPVASLVRMLSMLGMFTGFLGIALSVYGLAIYQMLNCSLLIISFYLIISEGSRRRILLCENVYAVIRERIQTPVRIRKKVAYQVSHDTPLRDLIELLRENTAVSFFFQDGYHLSELTEEAFCWALLSANSETIHDAYFDWMRSRENAFSQENRRFPS